MVGKEGASSPLGGALFPAPPGTTSEVQQLFYRQCKPGWQVCPLGYAVYSFVLVQERNTRLIVFGLKVVGVSTAQGKISTLSIKLDKADIERYARATMGTVEAIEARLQSIVSSGVHEFRNVNKDLYNIAYSLERELNNSRNVQRSHLEAAKSVVELSEMMKSRSDIFDVITNPSLAQIKDQDVHVYRAFDRARRSIIASSASRKLSLRMSGASDSRARAVQMFDVVPYILLQNAVKYSFDGEEVQINVIEDGGAIRATVSSWGPALSDDERSKVFAPGFRGKRAESFESQGSGMGLFVVKRLIEFCDSASVSLEQVGAPRLIQGMDFRRTDVRITLQIAS